MGVLVCGLPALSALLLEGPAIWHLAGYAAAFLLTSAAAIAENSLGARAV